MRAKRLGHLIRKLVGTMEPMNRKAEETLGLPVAPEHSDLAEWMPLIRKVVGMLVVLLGTYAAGSFEQSIEGDLKATESTATESIRDERNWLITYETLQDYVARESGCNAALEMFARHREDEGDWLLVVKNCHSDGVIEIDPRETSESPSPPPGTSGTGSP